MVELESRGTRLDEETARGLSVHHIGNGAGVNIPKHWREELGIEPVESLADAKYCPDERKIELYF